MNDPIVEAVGGVLAPGPYNPDTFEIDEEPEDEFDSAANIHYLEYDFEGIASIDDLIACLQEYARLWKKIKSEGFRIEYPITGGQVWVSHPEDRPLYEMVDNGVYRMVVSLDDDDE